MNAYGEEFTLAQSETREEFRERLLDLFYESSDRGEDAPPDLSLGVEAVYAQALRDANEADIITDATLRDYTAELGIDL